MKTIFKLMFLSLVLTASILGVMYIAMTQYAYSSFFSALAALVVPPTLLVFLALYGLVKWYSISLDYWCTWRQEPKLALIMIQTVEALIE